MAMINGMVASLVNNPMTINIAQKNSAKIVRLIEAGPPIPKGSENSVDLEAKFINFLKPCGIINPPNDRRSNSNENVMELAEYFVLKSFFMSNILKEAILMKSGL